MSGACAGLRVLDLGTDRAGALATMVLADYGAEVIRVENLGTTPALHGTLPLILNRGKKSIALDLCSEEGRAELRRLIPSVDAVVDSARPGELEALGLDNSALSQANPALIQCSITGFGRTGPLAGLKASDGLAMAKSGVLRDNPGWFSDNGRPVFRASKDGSHFCAMLAVQGVLAALRVRDATGQGQHVDVNMLHALTCRQNPRIRWLLREGEELPVEERAGAAQVQSEKNALPHHLDPRQVNLIGLRVECKDGRWLVHSHSEPHFFPAWIDVIGLNWIWDDDRFKGAPYKFADTETKLALVDIVQARMKERTATEWMEAYVANGNVCGDRVQSTAEALTHPQVIAADMLVRIEDPTVGQIVAIGPLSKMPEASPQVRGPAPQPGADNAAILGGAADAEAAFVTPDAPIDLMRPLDGVTIVEAAYYYATPFATSLLAELGARVIRIEPLKGDPYRALANAGTGDPVLNLGHNNMVRAMQGKESIQLNLKDPRGREIFYQLIADADAFIHCFRKGVPESLGIDYETLRKLNPRLVYHYGASYGSTGPCSRSPAIDPVIAAFAGTTDYQAGAGNAPLTETGADPIAASGHATALMLGLTARDRTGRGQYVESAMIVTNIVLNMEDAFTYEGKPSRPQVDHGQLGTGATYRLYETARVAAATVIEAHKNPDPRWVFLAVEEDDEFARFCEASGCAELVQDTRFATVAAREANDAALAALLEALFLTKPAAEWERELLAAGVGCVMADEMSNFAFLYRSEQAQAAGLMTTAEHPSFGGTYSRFAPVIRFSATPGVAGAFCEAGEHTRTILAELGYDPAVMAELKTSGVVTWHEDERVLSEANI